MLPALLCWGNELTVSQVFLLLFGNVSLLIEPGKKDVLVALYLHKSKNTKLLPLSGECWEAVVAATASGNSISSPISVTKLLCGIG